MSQPKSKEEIINELANEIHSTFASAYAINESVSHEWLKNVIGKALAQKDAEVVELTKDKERLDFLDKCNRGLNEYFGTTYKWEFILNHNVTRLMCGQGRAGDIDVDLNDANALGLPSCRDAIDKKMAEVTTPKE